MSIVTERPPVRTGKCSLILVIDGKRYRVTPAKPVSRGSKIWHLKVLPGQERAGRTYSVCSFRGKVDCTCPDATKNGAVCKHSRALQALGLVAKTVKPSVMVAWEQSQPPRPRGRKPAAPAAAEPKPSKRASRADKPDLPGPASALGETSAPVFARISQDYGNTLAPTQADPSDGFAVGSKNAVIIDFTALARQTADLAPDPETSFSAGWRAAVKETLEAMKTGKAGGR